MSMLSLLAEKYGDSKTVYAHFESTNQYPQLLDTDTFIANTNLGYYNELLALGQAYPDVGTEQPKNPATNSYTTRLRCVSDISEITQAGKAYLKGFKFSFLDAKNDAHTDAAVMAALAASITATNNQTYPQSRYLLSTSVDWQPNWFRPVIKVGRQNVLSSLQTNYFKTANAGDMSIGLGLPFCNNEFWMNVGTVTDLQVYAQCVQYIPGSNPEAPLTNPFLRYPITCTLEFRLFNPSVSSPYSK